MRMGRYFWIFVFSLISSAAYSADYYWLTGYSTTGIAVGSYRSNSASGSCDLLISSKGYTKTSFVYQTSTTFVCNYKVTSNVSGYTIIGRNGDSCPSGLTYDSATGSCVNPCAAKAGISERLSRTGALDGNDGVINLVVASNGKKYTARGPNYETGCMNGCMADTSGMKCTTNISHNLYACRGPAIYSGQTCATQGAIDPTATTLPDPEPQTIKDNQPCVYATDGTGKKTCISKNITETEGQQCGTFNGQDLCVSKLPSKNGVTIATEVTSVSNADGTSTETKKDTASTIKCDGYETCVTLVTTVTTTTQKDGNGNSTGASSSCTGAYCAGNTSPDANGDGLGDCVSGNCADGTGDGNGDGGGSWYTKTDDTFESVLQDFTVKAKQTAVISAMAGFLEYHPSGSCPVYQIDAWVFKATLNQWCTPSFPWDLVKAIVIGTSLFLAYRIAFE